MPPDDVAAKADELLAEILLTPEGGDDPYPRYAELREIAPVHHSTLRPLWVLTRFEDCRWALRDPHLGKGDMEGGSSGLMGDRPDDAPRMSDNSLLRTNPPDHTRLRSLVSRGFTPRRVEALRPAVESMVDDLCDTIAETDDVTDLMDVLAFPLPVRVIGELVGVPEPDRDQFRWLVRDSSAVIEPGSTPEQLDAARVSNEAMRAYFEDLVTERRRQPQDDLISILLEARDGEDRLTEPELMIMIMLIFAAGFETTTNLIGNGVHALLRHPDQLERLRADRSLIPSAVEEILRWDSSVQLDSRIVLEPVSHNGIDLAAGEAVLTLLGAANRDPAVFDDPDTLDVARNPASILSFATGIHYCLGASLARMEGQAVLAGLLDRFSDWELAEEPTRRRGITLRGFDHLPVRLTE